MHGDKKNAPPMTIMTETHETTKCVDCGTLIDVNGDTLQDRTSCTKCGSRNRAHSVSIIESIAIRDGYGLKAKRPGEKRPYIEDLSLPDFSRSRNKLVHRERVIDRDNDSYFEKITDYQTEEVIHHCEEPLSQHQGHGSAKNKMGSS